MRPEIALARTAARGGRYDIWTPSGGTASFTAQDAAHALAGCSSLGARLLLLKFGCGTDADRRPLAIELAFATPALIGAPRYDGAAVRGIDLMLGVVAEALTPLLCVACDGRGYKFIEARVEPCAPCDGTGRRRWSLSQRARECKVDKMTLSRTAWGRIYDQALAILLREEADALDMMATKLRRGRG